MWWVVHQRENGRSRSGEPPLRLLRFLLSHQRSPSRTISRTSRIVCIAATHSATRSVDLSRRRMSLPPFFDVPGDQERRARALLYPGRVEIRWCDYSRRLGTLSFLCWTLMGFQPAETLHQTLLPDSHPWAFKESRHTGVALACVRPRLACRGALNSRLWPRQVPLVTRTKGAESLMYPHWARVSALGEIAVRGRSPDPEGGSELTDRFAGGCQSA